VSEQADARRTGVLADRIEVGDEPCDGVRPPSLRPSATPLVPPNDPGEAAEQIGDAVEIVPEPRTTVTEHQRRAVAGLVGPKATVVLGTHVPNLGRRPASRCTSLARGAAMKVR